MKKVTDWADDLTYTGAMDFKDGADKAVEYAYDANGNMTRDRNKKIQSISYNILNLPSEVKFDDGHITRYTYDAAGTKLKAEYLMSNEQFMDWVMDGPAAETANVLSAGWNKGVDIGGIVAPSGSEIILKPVTQMTLQYIAGHIYRNGTLERVNNSFGYWADSSFHYNILDYQGNIRAVIAEDGTLEEVNNYYPYGGLMGAANFGVQPLKYGAKELDRENGLDLYDSKARWYDSMIGRTPTQDPLAEKYYDMSPYLWCAANPITLTDPTGKELKPKGEDELQVIKNTIPAEARRFVVINDEGFIDKNKLEEYSGDSYNFQILKYIVNSPITMFVELNDNYNYIDENGELKNSTMTYYDFNPLYDNEDDKDKTGSTISGLSTGETGKMGITLFPDRAGFSGSTNNTIHVIINKNLSEKGAAETYSHEANGHGALYILNGYNHRGASHHFRGTKDTNIKLIDMIIKSKTETVKNMK